MTRYKVKNLVCANTINGYLAVCGVVVDFNKETATNIAERYNGKIENVGEPNKLLEALECAQAMDLPAQDGMHVLEKYGFDYSDRFFAPASEFVKNKINEAITDARGES